MAPSAKGLPHSPLGMVLSARELVCSTGRFAAGTTLTITIERLMQDERFGSFECTIQTDNAPCHGPCEYVPAQRGRINLTFLSGSFIMTRSVLVTGASKGIGRAIAVSLPLTVSP